MFYKTKVKDHIRVPPKYFGDEVEAALFKQIRSDYEGYISKDMGVVIDVSAIEDIQQGVIVSGDGAAYYETTFSLLTFKPELQEVVPGQIKDMADFGAFINMGPIEGMIHISQTMDDFVSFSKDKVLLGKESKKSLKIGDKCRARVIAVSYKDTTNPKFGLTMRQKGLGRLEWIPDDLNPPKKGGK
ncbi:DNA-directed RNA polymerase [archaeon]|jgi:DNA-directed RNA polymerase subunit E'|nr:DNA-directed RNA polymerase [archaeon]MBT4272767.1 DNA-directed RNA polymerase [archaeon]MBT4461566.1 DNA-directed RNA polymerase [archaeon]MBT4857666.1 DNA-directed RNA polymerase [archaeon]MBT5423242.1 DNA-directed RNA polymerase [archaeon]